MRTHSTASISRNLAGALASLVLVISCGYAQRVEYRISFENAVHHEAEVSATFSGLPVKPLDVIMSRSSPGRYALHEFAKNVYNVRAADGKGKPLPVSRPDPYRWEVSGHDGTVVFTYTLFADHPDGTYAGIDLTHAHLNMPATFVWAKGLENAPVKIAFQKLKDSNWNIATQLFPTSNPAVFTAPGLQYFMDCPTELSHFSLREWTVSSGDTSTTIRLAVHHTGTEEELDAYAALAKAVTCEEKAVYGELPAYDVGRYTFIADYLPYVNGDGMEHRNSTIIMSTRPLKTNYLSHIGTLAHEYFHSWNVKRIRPKSLEPFDFEAANMSGELWFAEGFTNYYGELILRRAGIVSLDRYAKNITGAVNAVINLPGRKYFTPVEMSEQAPFVDAAVSVDEQNKRNTFISYYTYGEAIALGLDLTLRTQYPGTTLDDLMRAAWKAHGKPEKPYTNDDIRKLLGEITHDDHFAETFFRHYVEGHDVVDYGTLLSNGGLLLRKTNEKKSWLGTGGMSFEDGKAIVGAPPLVGSPLYAAGIDRRDRILKIAGVTIAAPKDIDTVLAKHKPGETAEIEFEQRGVTKTSTITFEEQQQMEIVPYELVPLPVTEAIRTFREQWLGTHAQEKLPPLTKSCSLCKRQFPFEFEYCHFDGDTLRLVLEQHPEKKQ